MRGHLGVVAQLGERAWDGLALEVVAEALCTVSIEVITSRDMSTLSGHSLWYLSSVVPFCLSAAMMSVLWWMEECGMRSDVDLVL